VNILLVNELRIEFGSLFVYLLLTDIKMLVKLRPLLRFYRINFTAIYEMRFFLRFCDLILTDVFEPSHSSVVEFDVMVSADGSGGIRLLQVIRNVVIGVTSTIAHPVGLKRSRLLSERVVLRLILSLI
jgi:hypothetical protein